MFKKILVPLDSSDLAERALEPALNIASQQPESEVILLSVPIYRDIVVPTTVGFDLLLPEQSLEQFREDVEAYLANTLKKWTGPETQLRTTIVEGDVASAIVDTAEAEDIDLIVMTTHGYSGFSRWLLGSVTERVLRSAPCPVLALRQKRPLTNILITLDGSQLAETALEPGIELARILGGKVTLLEVDQDANLGALELSMLELAQTGMSRHVQPDSEDDHLIGYLNRMAEKYRQENMTVETVVVEDAPARGILEYAENEKVDLIVMTTHGRTGLKRWVYGSVTEKVLRSTQAAVMIIRPLEEQLN
ncbi:MAG: universal stress protein [Candidatus Promineifilaceae bacterium]